MERKETRIRIVNFKDGHARAQITIENGKLSSIIDKSSIMYLGVEHRLALGGLTPDGIIGLAKVFSAVVEELWQAGYLPERPDTPYDELPF